MFVDLICLVYLFMSVEFLFYAFKYKTLVPRFLSCLVVISVRGAECPLTEFGGLNVFGHPVFIYSVVQSRSNVPASNFQKKNQKLDPNSGFFFVGRIKPWKLELIFSCYNLSVYHLQIDNFWMKLDIESDHFTVTTVFLFKVCLFVFHFAFCSILFVFCVFFQQDKGLEPMNWENAKSL